MTEQFTIVGIGGAGLTIIDQIQAQQFGGLRTVAIDTFAAALTQTSADIRLLIGTTDNGSGGDPARGNQAAHTSAGAIAELLDDTTELVLVASMGGGTGGGATPVLAYFAVERQLPVRAVVTMPFKLEGTKRQPIAERSLATLKGQIQDVHVIHNQHLLRLAGTTTPELAQLYQWSAQAAAWRVLLSLL